MIETESELHSFPGPKPGKRVTVIYDPLHPYDADTTGRRAVYLAITPIIALVGLGLLIYCLMSLF